MDQVWKAFWYSVAAAVVGLAATVGGCTAYESGLVADAVRKGVDPIDARCGISGPTNSMQICTVRAALKAK